MTRRAVALVAVVLASLAGCTDDDPTPSSTTTSTAADPLDDLLITPDDLPDGFAPNPDVDDTITAFCAGQDAAAGLQASSRAIVGFNRTPAGASVIHLVFRFDDDGAARFVSQADELLTSCSEVPDATGLAFTYEPVSPALTTALEGVDASATRYGTSIGSGNLTLNVGVFHQDDIGVLVAVLGLETHRDELDELAAEAFTAAAERLR